MFPETVECQITSIVFGSARNSPCHSIFPDKWDLERFQTVKVTFQGYIESAEQSRMAEQNKISKLTVKLQIILTEHDCRM